MHQINLVKKFQEVFKIPLSENPTLINDSLVDLRHRLMQEENEEYLEACRENDLGKIADALGDMMYILYGTILTHGLQYKMNEIFEEIHRSNMSKLDDNGKPIYREDGKIMKSPNYFLPDIRRILNREEVV
jgi:predicted HAD superfamily Cof-like phosphohydrolase